MKEILKKREWERTNKFKPGDKLLWAFNDDRGKRFERTLVVKEILEDSVRAVIKKKNRTGASVFISTWNEADFQLLPDK